MKGILIALTMMVTGFSTGCAQIEYLQNPANYRMDPLTGKRMYCHGDSRDNYTICEGWKPPAQIAQEAEQEKSEAQSVQIAAKKRELIEAEIERERARNGNEGSLAYTEEEEKLFEWSEALTVEQLQKALKEKERERIATAKEQVAREKAAQAARRKTVYTLVGEKRFAQIDKLLSDDVSIASKIAGAKIGLKEWTIGMDWTRAMTSRMSSCVSGFKTFMPELFEDQMSDAQVAARDAFQPLFDSFQMCVAKSTVLEEPVDVILGFKKGKLTHVQYQLDLEHKDLLLKTLKHKYGNPDKTDKKVQTREEIAQQIRKDSAKASCALYPLQRKREDREQFRKLCDQDSFEAVGTASFLAGIQVPADGARYEEYVWKASHTMMEYANEWAESNERKSYLRVVQVSSLNLLQQSANESKRLANDIVKAYSLNREAVRNKQRSKDF